MEIDLYERAASEPRAASWSVNGTTDSKKLQQHATGYVYDPVMMDHRELDVEEDEGPHPEQPLRIQRIYMAIKDAGYLERMQQIKIREASQQEVELVHSPEHWNRVMSFGGFDEIHIRATKEFYQRMSLYLNPNSPKCARFSCGGVIDCCRAVVEGQIRNAFAIVRPPGHHAEPEQEMGFCFFNNVAVAAKYMRTAYPEKIKRILVLDWDVHHGNGTQKAFWNDPSILYISVHLFQNGEFYPGGPDGALDQVGDGPGKGFNVNIPWDEDKMGDADYLFAFQKIIMPIAYEYAPDMIIVSAGYDAAQGDELGRCNVTPAGFAHMTHMLSSLANGKLVLALEGGYSLDAIATSALECVKVMLGENPPLLPPMTASESATQVLFSVALEQSKYWQSITPKAPEAKTDIEKAVSTVPLSQILKAHRAAHLYHTAGLVNAELADDHLQSIFEDQVFCSENVYEAETLLVFVHDLGTINALIGARDFNVQLEKSYMIDTTQAVIDWATMQDFGIIDVNIMARAPLRRTRIMPARSAELTDEKKLAIFVWDNFVQLGQAHKVIFVGTGQGCEALTYVINHRTREVQRKLKGSVMICGRHRPPLLLDNEQREGLRSWYHRISHIICPSTHDLVDPEMGKLLRYGHLINSGESRPLHVLHSSWSSISAFFSKQLAQARNGSEALR